jgi:NaMN:DMB phosphoribosyltransferase
MRVTEPPQKNDPEIYFEATTHHMAAIPAAPKFDKVTEPASTTNAKQK